MSLVSAIASPDGLARASVADVLARMRLARPAAAGTQLVHTRRMLVDLAAYRKRSEVSEKQTAVVVEDDPRLRRAVSEELARMNLDVLSANHFDAAIRHLETRRAHIVCIDIGLPEKSGYELCEHIRGTMGLTRMPILLMSEYGTSHDKACAEHAGANAFLLKPFSISQLNSGVRSLLDQATDRSSPVHELARTFGVPSGWRRADGARDRRAPVQGTAVAGGVVRRSAITE
jgi:CheY-like chemotaxis protein